MSGSNTPSTPQASGNSQFLADTLAAMEPSEEPVTIVTDGAYLTPSNQKLTETKNVHIVSTNMPEKKQMSSMRALSCQMTAGRSLHVREA